MSPLFPPANPQDGGTQLNSPLPPLPGQVPYFPPTPNVLQNPNLRELDTPRFQSTLTSKRGEL